MGAPWAVREAGALEQAPQEGGPPEVVWGGGHILAEKSEGQRPCVGNILSKLQEKAGCQGPGC